jgi:hypothetical protein
LDNDHDDHDSFSVKDYMKMMMIQRQQDREDERKQRAEERLNCEKESAMAMQQNQWLQKFSVLIGLQIAEPALVLQEQY